MYVCGKNVVREYLNSDEKIKGAIVFENFNDEEILKKITANFY